jgi:hypothetical protein
MSIADKLTTIAENVPKVHEAGKQAGEREWQKKYQKEGRNGKKGYYICAYAGWGWTNETFNPVWDIVPSNASNMFNYSHITGNISKLCQQKGVRLDFSQCVGFQNAFVNASITGVDTVDTRSCTDLSTIFYAAPAMEEINDLILKDDGSQTFGRQSFLNCKNLVTLKITGTIGKSVTFENSPLNRASIENVINALFATATGQTLTLNKAAVNKAFETSEGANDGSTSAEWSALRATKSNWTISLV